MTYAYHRFSTSSQDETEQRHIIEEYARKNDMTIDAIVKDEGISGGVSYRDRNLYDLVQMLQHGDCLIVSEISRLGRSISDINILVNEELKPRGVRLVCIKTGVDIDCSNINAIGQMQIFAFSFAAQLEKELIVERTQSALDARKELIKKDGGFFSKSGHWCTKFGPRKLGDISQAQFKGGRVISERVRKWREESPLYLRAQLLWAKGKSADDILADTAKLYEQNPKKYCTMQGKQLKKATLYLWMKEWKETM